MRRWRTRRHSKWLWLLAGLVAGNVLFVMTAANSVPTSYAANYVGPIVANDLKPAECVSANLTSVLGGTAVINGTAANELLLGSDLADTISGAGGDDCLVGGPGGDTLNGGLGTDVCLGGPGTDTFIGCETQIQ